MRKVRTIVMAQWQAVARTLHSDLMIIPEKPQSILRHRIQLEGADLIVCFRCQSEVIFFLRDVLKLSSRLAIYSHGSSSIAMSNFYPILRLLKPSDAIIFASDADKKAAEIFIGRVPGRVVSLGYESHSVRHWINYKKKTRDVYDFDFVGRLSLQKNFLQVLEALHILKKRNIRFRVRVFGKIDNLGIPQIGWQDRITLKERIQALLQRDDLGDWVEFLGESRLSDIQKNAIRRRSILISPSTQLDENFGFAVRERLAIGGKVVLTHWGGYADAINLFPELCFPVLPSIHASGRPTVKPALVAQAILRAMRSDRELSERKARQRIEDAHSEALRSLIELTQRKPSSVSRQRPYPKQSLCRVIQNLKPTFPKHHIAVFQTARNSSFRKLILVLGCHAPTE